MLVCSISQRPSRRAISADLAEVAAAVDATATGFLVLATLVDDPASVGDFVDAYLGEIMVEAASSADSCDAGLVYVAAIDEAALGADSVDAGSGAIVAAQRTLSASRAGLGSTVVDDDGGGKTRVIANIGAVT